MPRGRNPAGLDSGHASRTLTMLCSWNREKFWRQGNRNTMIPGEEEGGDKRRPDFPYVPAGEDGMPIRWVLELPDYVPLVKSQVENLPLIKVVPEGFADLVTGQ